MKIMSHEVVNQDNQFVLDLGGGSSAFLVVKANSHPVRVWSGSATVSSGTSHDIRAAMDEAGSWLVEEIRQGRVILATSDPSKTIVKR